MHVPLSRGVETPQCQNAGFLCCYNVLWGWRCELEHAMGDKGVAQKLIGVALHRFTKRYEAHLWIANGVPAVIHRRRGRQLYIGSFEHQRDAVFAHDVMSVKMRGIYGASTNAHATEYERYVPFLATLDDDTCKMLLRQRAFEAAFLVWLRETQLEEFEHDDEHEVNIVDFETRSLSDDVAETCDVTWGEECALDESSFFSHDMHTLAAPHVDWA